MTDEDNTGSFNLSEGAIKYLESQTVPAGQKKSVDIDFTFQIERATKNSGGIFNCTLLDNDSKYGGFLLTYEPKDGVPGVGDIIKQHEKWPEIVEWEYSDEPLMEVKSNADRRGYFLYQKKDGRICI